ncbi:hypothetical protein BGZ65_007188 [Modicella reniformis]|uniref:Serine hydrolase domain-containing protein n=1 Tax=Modicella reniformis TaxID=1440133 RepID=A0A9P6SSG0_9FUNG|nr:hypothetical protein BGZ65_007188 [Modicella reniformis]
MPLLRILCLHGYTQNALSFSKKTAVLRRTLKDVADLVYITAPHIVPIPTLETPEARENDQLENLEPEAVPYGWWRGPDYKGFDESLTVLQQVLEKQGPFDGVLGFSQGASMASLLQLLLERPHLSPTMNGYKHNPFKFAIMVSGFEPRNEALISWYTNKYPVLQSSQLHEKTTENGVGERIAETTTTTTTTTTMHQDDKTHEEPPLPSPSPLAYLYGVQGASMHIIGRNDVIIEPERSEGLLKHYTNKKPVVLYHDGGHYLPSNAASRQAYKTFVQSFI